MLKVQTHTRASTTCSVTILSSIMTRCHRRGRPTTHYSIGMRTCKGRPSNLTPWTSATTTKGSWVTIKCTISAMDSSMLLLFKLQMADKFINNWEIKVTHQVESWGKVMLRMVGPASQYKCRRPKIPTKGKLRIAILQQLHTKFTNMDSRSAQPSKLWLFLELGHSSHLIPTMKEEQLQPRAARTPVYSSFNNAWAAKSKWSLLYHSRNMKCTWDV